MSVQISEVTEHDDFPKVTAALQEGFSNPYTGIWPLVKGPSIDSIAKRLWDGHVERDGSHWIMATDSATGTVLGVAEWVAFKESPFAGPMEPIKATWWPEGDRREMAEQVLNLIVGSRPLRMSRPHLMLNWLCVTPAARRRGAAMALMSWGTRLADELGLEAFIESTEIGRPMYERAGFVTVSSFVVDVHNVHATAGFDALKREIVPRPERSTIMWRPAGGVFEPGKTQWTWDEAAAAETVSKWIEASKQQASGTV